MAHDGEIRSLRKIEEQPPDLHRRARLEQRLHELGTERRHAFDDLAGLDEIEFLGCKVQQLQDGPFGRRRGQWIAFRASLLGEAEVIRQQLALHVPNLFPPMRLEPGRQDDMQRREEIGLALSEAQIVAVARHLEGRQGSHMDRELELRLNAV